MLVNCITANDLYNDILHILNQVTPTLSESSSSETNPDQSSIQKKKNMVEKHGKAWKSMESLIFLSH